MAAIEYRQLALRWHPDSDRDHRFNAIAAVTLVVLLAIALAMTWIPLPRVERVERAAVPERVARFILERPKPRPPAPPPPPRTEMRIQRPAADRKPLSAAEEKARKAAQTAGLLALSRELSALADSSGVSTMVDRKLNTAPAGTAAATVDTGILTSDTGRRSIGVRADAHAGRVGTTRLDDGQRQAAAQELLVATAGQAGGRGGSGGEAAVQGASPRRFEDVAVVMDQHKGALYAIYNRTRRTQPGIKGKVVLVLTIQPSGQVSNVVIKSSELNAPELEASLVARIRQFDFGKRPGGPLTVTIPVEFLPS